MGYEKESYEWYKAHHVCPWCKTRDAVPGHVYCGECMFRKTEAYHATKDRQLINTKCRDRYKRYRDEGLCVRCGRKARPGMAMCQACQDKQSRAHKRVRARKSVIKASDECLSCGRKRVEGYAYCEEHLEIRRAVLARNRPQHIGQSHPWRRKTGQK